MSLDFTKATPDWCTCGDIDPNWNFSTNIDFSISLWIKRASLLSIQYLIAKNRVDILMPGAVTWGLNFSALDVLTLTFNGGTRAGGTLSDTASWHHIAVAVDRDTRTSFWIDGVLVDDSLVNSSLSNVARNVRFGTRNGTFDANNFDGKMEDVAIWKNRLLTQAEVSALFNTRVRANRFLTGLIQHWPMDYPGDGIYNTMVTGDYGCRQLIQCGIDASIIEDTGTEPDWSTDSPKLIWPRDNRVISRRRKTRIQNVLDYGVLPYRLRRKEYGF